MTDDEAGRLRAALDAAAIDLEALACTDRVAGRRGGRGDLRRSGVVRDGPGHRRARRSPRLRRARPRPTAILSVTDAARGCCSLPSMTTYFRERAADVRDVGRRVAAHIRGENAAGPVASPTADPAVVVADRSRAVSRRHVSGRELVAGIALARWDRRPGTRRSWRAALGIPMVLGLGSAIDEHPARRQDRRRRHGRARRDRAWCGGRDAAPGRHRASTGDNPPAPDPSDRTTAGSSVSVRVAANVGSPFEADAALSAGADGIGLVRTELLFLGRHTPPTVEEQRATYARIRAAMDGRPVVFRTLDVGGDKPAPWQTGPAESNPALGSRGVASLVFAHEDAWMPQLKAIPPRRRRGRCPRDAPDGGGRRGHSPRARALLAKAGVFALKGPRDPLPGSGLIPVGAMIEIPGCRGDRRSPGARGVDFFSIGTNDLIQYGLAVDRTNPELADLASALQPADHQAHRGRRSRRPNQQDDMSAVCGEAAADPMVIPLLVGLGVDRAERHPQRDRIRAKRPARPGPRDLRSDRT